jgi:hypothetical protein
MEEQHLRKVMLLLLAGIYTVLGLLWGSTYLALGLPLAGSIPHPGGYQSFAIKCKENDLS